MRAAIDFGISNVDAVAGDGTTLRRWTQPVGALPTTALVEAILDSGGLRLDQLDGIAVTGGQHRTLPPVIGSCPITPVGELAAIGRGGQHLGAEMGLSARAPLLVVSAGSGTAVVSARGSQYAHITGSGVGGGTLLGLGRLLLHTVDPGEIDMLAATGDPNGADLALRDVISGPIGSLPPDATAVNFGRLARHDLAVSRADLAAALVTLVAQVIAVTAINAARAQQLDHIVVIGHLTDMPSVRRVLDQVGDYYGMRLTLPPDAGYGTAIGALLQKD